MRSGVDIREQQPGRRTVIGRFLKEFLRVATVGRLRPAGNEILDCRYVGFCEMIFKARKPLKSGPRPA